MVPVDAPLKTDIVLITLVEKENSKVDVLNLRPRLMRTFLLCLKPVSKRQMIPVSDIQADLEELVELKRILAELRLFPKLEP